MLPLNQIYLGVVLKLKPQGQLYHNITFKASFTIVSYLNFNTIPHLNQLNCM